MLVAEDSSAQGGEYVEAYIELTHFIESIYHAVSPVPATNMSTTS